MSLFWIVLLSFTATYLAALPPLTPWTLSDWDAVGNQFTPGTNFAMKDYIWSSIMPNQTTIYNTVAPMPWAGTTVNVVTNWGTVQSPTYGAEVPGPFDYKQGWEKWAGDKISFGPGRYSIIISSFGHRHIQSVYMRNIVLMSSANTNLLHFTDPLLEHLAGASMPIFAFFGGLLDTDANFISIPPQNNANTCFQRMTMLAAKNFIFGNGSAYGQPGSVLNPMELGQFMDMMIGAFSTSPQHHVVLVQIKNDLIGHLMDQLLNLTVPLIAWEPLMRAHQHHSSSGFEIYHELYNNPGPTSLAAANTHYEEGVTMGRQIGAFFTAFGYFSDFLDKLILTSYDEYAIPMDVHIDRLNEIARIQKQYWSEHVTLFQDFNKACGRRDFHQMYVTAQLMLNSCDHLAGSIGYLVFKDFDTLVRHRMIYSHLLFPVVPLSQCPM